MGNGGTTSASARRSPRCAALLLIDIINPFDFDDGDILADNALASADAMLRLRDAADALEAPVIYVNDNYGRWNSDNAALIEGCARHSSKARELIEKLRPRPSDYFVIKPQFSGFYATNLPVLLPTSFVARLKRWLGVHRLLDAKRIDKTTRDKYDDRISGSSSRQRDKAEA